ncbi:Hypothetical predicted protein [Paramuricea clavata]|uniref:Endonuclease/exonuclease/phosphatase domain-containing protein n=1 Tax=Paramuricea clavata TaxID=317549 RepID=A0A7D9DU88_PARCT|nr:Hypothetical predicted protein [Paramuricea clavata]
MLYNHMLYRQNIKHPILREDVQRRGVLYEERLDLLLNYNAEGQPPQQQKQSSTNSHCSHSNLINIPLLAPATIYSPTNSDTTKPDLNVRLLRNIAHLTEVKELVNLHKIDIFTISETWLNSTVTNSEIAIEDYKIYRLDRLHKRGGGVCAYIKKNLKASVLKELSQISESSFHQLWINIQSKKNRSIIICVTYRPPDCALNCFDDHFKPNYIQVLTTRMNQPIFVLGDLNCNVLHDGPDRKAIVEVSTERNLQQIIKKPTRITDTTQSLIDVILVSNTASVGESGVLNSAICNHLRSSRYVILKVKAPKIPPNYITARSYKYYDPLHFSSNLAVKSDDLLSIFSDTDVNTQLETFKNTLHSTLDVHAPVKIFKV